MNRRKFMFQTSLIAVGSVLLSNYSGWARIAHPLSFSKMMTPGYRSKIISPFCPGVQVDGKIGIVINPNNALQQAQFYKTWYKEIVCFTNGKKLTPNQIDSLKLMGVLVNQGKIIQINETPNTCNITTTTKSESVGVLYQDQLRFEQIETFS